MTVRDPREVYDDLIVDRVERDADAEEFAALYANEAFRAGWVAGGIVLDDDDRVLLAYHGHDEAWLAPGGTLAPGESLRDTLIREVREETGVEIHPGRPHALVESVVHHDDDYLRFRYVLFCARAIDPETGENLGEPDEPIEDAQWFEELPDNVYGQELTAKVLKRCQEGID